MVNLAKYVKTFYLIFQIIFRDTEPNNQSYIRGGAKVITRDTENMH